MPADLVIFVQLELRPAYMRIRLVHQQRSKHLLSEPGEHRRNQSLFPRLHQAALP